MTAFSYSDDEVLLTTSHEVPGREITAHHGVVVADVTPGRNIGKDIAGGLRDIVGGRSGSWEKTLEANQETALDELVEEAKSVGADAVVALDVTDEALGGQGGMINIKAFGTAVSLD
ncbi:MULTISPECIES: YbjQ family protein [unclassified Haladaptatus]|uniref:YbjQ family protein n=1 Tax=unclassified Haladaptatus TaxID=2622732 RepID=UPI00209C1119|nr:MULTISPECIES: YbjQ family protein [unclassified Haladaptatus]MCO8245265.1 YbjQ family protein [Haladaptatus sp. AB643]MCO8253410.1 YbjQ family protein [Haladaptatus sp. AB618]